MIDRKLSGNAQKEQILATLKCESSFNPNAVGDKGKSFGLAQIHIPSWKKHGITKEDALNPEFAMDFIIEQFAIGKQRHWTCWRQLYS